MGTMLDASKLPSWSVDELGEWALKAVRLQAHLSDDFLRYIDRCIEAYGADDHAGTLPRRVAINGVIDLLTVLRKEFVQSFAATAEETSAL